MIYLFLKVHINYWSDNTFFFLQLNIGSRIDLWQMLSSLKSSDNASKSCWLESTHSHLSWINGMGMFIKSENKYGH